MMLCPLNFDCKLMGSSEKGCMNERECKLVGEAWPLPYRYTENWFDYISVLVVNFTAECTVHQVVELVNEGFAQAINLPYRYYPGKGNKPYHYYWGEAEQIEKNIVRHPVLIVDTSIRSAQFVRDEIHEAGWYNAQRLPYKVEEGALIVTDNKPDFGFYRAEQLPFIVNKTWQLVPMKFED